MLFIKLNISKCIIFEYRYRYRYKCRKNIYPCNGPLQQLYPSWVCRALGSKVHSLPICASLISARVTSFYLQSFSAYIFYSLILHRSSYQLRPKLLQSGLAGISQEASVPDFRSSPVSRQKTLECFYSLNASFSGYKGGG